MTISEFELFCIKEIEQRIYPCSDFRWIPSIASGEVEYFPGNPPYVVDARGVEYTINTGSDKEYIRVRPLVERH